MGSQQQHEQHEQNEDKDRKFTVDEALVAMGFGRFQYLVLGYAGMGWISEAMEMMLLSFVGPAIRDEWKLSSHAESLITSIVFAGMLVGAYSWGIVSDKHGRRNGFLITALVTSLAGFLSSFAPNYIALIFLRCLVGLGLGGSPVLSSWFLEFIPAPDRGTWMVVFSAFWTVGTILEASLAWIVMPTLGWRWLLALSALPSFILLLFFSFAPESPRYLCLNGRKTEALAILKIIAKLNRVELPSGVLVSEHKPEHNENVTPTEDTDIVSTDSNENKVVTAHVVARIQRSPKLQIPTEMFSSLVLQNFLGFCYPESLWTDWVGSFRCQLCSSYVVFSSPR